LSSAESTQGNIIIACGDRQKVWSRHCGRCSVELDYGKLCYRDSSSATVIIIDDSHRYCWKCLEREQTQHIHGSHKYQDTARWQQREVWQITYIHKPQRVKVMQE
jgi:hypothetical protein